jgi:hypothetical protein
MTGPFSARIVTGRTAGRRPDSFFVPPVDSTQAFLDRALILLQRSDPIPKLLPQVRFGRMAKDAPGLQAIVSSWLETFCTVLQEAESFLDVMSTRRLDPNPRIAVLLEAGVLTDNDPQVVAVREAYAAVYHAAQQRANTGT